MYLIIFQIFTILYSAFSLQFSDAPFLLSSLFDNFSNYHVQPKKDNIISLETSSVVSEAIIVRNLNSKIFGSKNARIITLNEKKYTPAFIILNSSFCIYETSISLEDGRILSNINHNGEFNLSNVKLDGILNRNNLFSVNGGGVNLNNIQIPKFSQINSFVNVEEKGSVLFVSNSSFEDISVDEDGLFFSNDSYISNCLICNITEGKGNRKLKIGNNQNAKNNIFKRSENVLLGLLLNNNCYKYFNSNNNSYYKTYSSYHEQLIYQQESASFTNDSFEGCVGNTYSGGAILVIDGNLKIRFCSFISCKSNEDGGAVFVNSGTSYLLNINSSSFDNCSCNDCGGAVVPCNLSYFVIRFSNFTGNKGVYGGCAFYMLVDLSSVFYECYFNSSNATYGGALYWDRNCTDNVTCTNCYFYDNDGTDGDDLYFDLDSRFRLNLFYYCTSNSEGYSVYVRRRKKYANPFTRNYRDAYDYDNDIDDDDDSNGNGSSNRSRVVKGVLLLVFGFVGFVAFTILVCACLVCYGNKSCIFSFRKKNDERNRANARA